MANNRRIRQRRQRRTLRVRSHIKSTAARPRVSVFRSLNHIYAQIIDDGAGVTLASSSSTQLQDVKGDKKTVAHAVGKELATRAQEKGITAAVFDRGVRLYHGRVKALAEGLREGGLTI